MTHLVVFVMGILVAYICILIFSPDRSEMERHEKRMKGSYEMTEGKILKVYSADQDGAAFRAYVVEWNGREIVISDTLRGSQLNIGDTLMFMVHRIEFNQLGREIKALQFVAMEKPKTIELPPNPLNNPDTIREIEELRARAEIQREEVEALELRLLKQRNNELSAEEESQLKKDVSACQATLEKQREGLQSLINESHQSR